MEKGTDAFLFKNTTVVCVTDQFKCERLIAAGRKIANIFKTNLSVINITKSDVGQINTDAIEFLFKKSKEYSAEMNILSSDDAIKAIIGVIRQTKATHIITGLPGDNSEFLDKLWSRVNKNVKCYTVDLDGNINPVVKEKIQINNKANALNRITLNVQ